MGNNQVRYHRSYFIVIKVGVHYHSQGCRSGDFSSSPRPRPTFSGEIITRTSYHFFLNGRIILQLSCHIAHHKLIAIWTAWDGMVFLFLWLGHLDLTSIQKLMSQEGGLSTMLSENLPSRNIMVFRKFISSSRLSIFPSRSILQYRPIFKNKVEHLSSRLDVSSSDPRRSISQV